jgi:hypothetical protein
LSRDAYHKVKSRKVGRELREFSFSEKYIFGRFDSFCVRLKNLLGKFKILLLFLSPSGTILHVPCVDRADP